MFARVKPDGNAMTAEHSIKPGRHRGWRTTRMAVAAMAACLSWAALAADPLTCPQQPGSLGSLLCEARRHMQEVCGEVDASVRGHCHACLLANSPLSCDDVDDAEAPGCHRARAAITRCVASGPARIDACLRRSVMGQIRLTTPGVMP